MQQPWLLICLQPEIPRVVCGASRETLLPGPCLGADVFLCSMLQTLRAIFPSHDRCRVNWTILYAGNLSGQQLLSFSFHIQDCKQQQTNRYHNNVFSPSPQQIRWELFCLVLSFWEEKLFYDQLLIFNISKCLIHGVDQMSCNVTMPRC